MQGAEAALREVVDVTDQLRARGLSLLKLLEVARDVGPREMGADGEGPRANGAAAKPDARKAHVLGLLKDHEKEVRDLLKTLQERVGEVERRDNKNKKPAGETGGGETLTDLDNYESSEASRSIAIKGVSRDIAHSLQNEIAWRDAAFKAANEADAFFHERLTTLFPDVEVGRRRRQLKKRARRRKATSSRRQSLALKAGKTQKAPSNGTRNGSGGDSASKQAVTTQSLSQALKSLPGLADFTTEHGGKRWRPLKKLTLVWRNGLRTSLHFGPARKQDEITAASPPAPLPASSSPAGPEKSTSGSGAEDLGLGGVRLVWVSADSQHAFLDTSHAAEGDPRSSEFASELAARAQQRHFSWLQEHSEAEATFKLLKWLAARVNRGPHAFPR